MRTVTQIDNELRDIKQKINSLSIEKSEKQKEIEDLKSSNIRLLVNSADKERKPASLGAQTNKIGITQIELEQLTKAINVLEEQQNALQDELFVAELKQELDSGYFTLRDNYLSKAKSIQNGLKTMLEYGKCLTEQIAEFNKTPSPLMAGNLYNIFKRCKTLDQFSSLGFDWPLESAHFKMCDAIMADERTLDKLVDEIGRFSSMFLSLEQSFIPSIGAAIPRE